MLQLMCCLFLPGIWQVDLFTCAESQGPGRRVSVRRHGIMGKGNKETVMNMSKALVPIDHQRKSGKKGSIKNVALGASVVGGSTAAIAGTIAAGTSSTAAISAAGAAIGGVTGGVVGSGFGLVTGGFGMAATVPFATAGAAIGGWAGPALALVGIGTAPAWAVPVAVGGAVVAVSGVVVAAYRFGKTHKSRGI